MAYELNVWANVFMNCAAGSTRTLIAKELEIVRQDLEATKKESTNLSLRLVEALKTAEENREKADSNLTQAQNNNRQLKRANDDLKLDLQKASGTFSYVEQRVVEIPFRG